MGVFKSWRYYSWAPVVRNPRFGSIFRAPDCCKLPKRILNKYQHHLSTFEVSDTLTGFEASALACQRRVRGYLILWLEGEYGARMLVIMEAPSVGII